MTGGHSTQPISCGAEDASGGIGRHGRSFWRGRETLNTKFSHRAAPAFPTTDIEAACEQREIGWCAPENIPVVPCRNKLSVSRQRDVHELLLTCKRNQTTICSPSCPRSRRRSTAAERRSRPSYASSRLPAQGCQGRWSPPPGPGFRFVHPRVKKKQSGFGGGVRHLRT